MRHPGDCQSFSLNTLLDKMTDELLCMSAGQSLLLSNGTARPSGKLLRSCGQLRGCIHISMVDISSYALFANQLSWSSAMPSQDHLHALRDGTSVCRSTISLLSTQKVKTTHLTFCLDILVQKCHMLKKNQLNGMSSSLPHPLPKAMSLAEIQRATKKDKTLQKLTEFIHTNK